MRFGPMPLIARRSSTLLNWPYDLRIFRILSAVDGPVPGTRCNSSVVAVFRFTGCSGGLLFARKTGAPTTIRQRENSGAAKATARLHGTPTMRDGSI
jgi:hypothetical protein